MRVINTLSFDILNLTSTIWYLRSINMAAKTEDKPKEEEKTEVEAKDTPDKSPKGAVEKPPDKETSESLGTESKKPKSVLTPSKEEFEEAKEEDESSESDEGGSKKKYVLFVIAAIVLGILVGAVVYFVQQKGLLEGSKSKVREEQAVEEESVEDTESMETEQLERGEITIVILNGAGVAGLAGDTATTFEELGYTVSETGNADLISGNELYLNPDVEGMVEVLLADVESELGISTVSGELEDSEVSAQIVLGE